MNEIEEQKKIEIVSGTGKDLDISPVYDHLNVNRSQQKPKNIVIPKSRSENKEEKTEQNEEEDSSDENNKETE